jgi:hypothetical protein
VQRPFKKAAPTYAVAEELSVDSRERMNNVRANRIIDMIHDLPSLSTSHV